MNEREFVIATSLVRIRQAKVLLGEVAVELDSSQLRHQCEDLDKKIIRLEKQVSKMLEDDTELGYTMSGEAV